MFVTYMIGVWIFHYLSLTKYNVNFVQWLYIKESYQFLM